MQVKMLKTTGQLSEINSSRELVSVHDQSPQSARENREVKRTSKLIHRDYTIGL